jgi:HEAT repeat protein
MKRSKKWFCNHRRKRPMKKRPLWILLWLLIVVATIFAMETPRRNNSGPQMVAETRKELRAQGFKADLSDFNFSTSQEMQAREAVLEAAAPDQIRGSLNSPIMMEIVGTNAAAVVCRQTALKTTIRPWPDYSGEMSWDNFRESISAIEPQADAACDVILSGPIAFDLDASGGQAMLIPHLGVIRNLSEVFGCRMILAIHDGNQGAAWTNLLAATRLITAWQTEPVEISQIVRFRDTSQAFNTTWQALQGTRWPDNQLARLQAEWESVNFFTNLPETVAFTRASQVAALERRPQEAFEGREPFGEFVQQAIRAPTVAWEDLYDNWQQQQFREGGIYEDEKGLLLFYRDREIELRNAVQAGTWKQMRSLPGVANTVSYQSKYHSPATLMLHLHETNLGFQLQGSSFLGLAAEAEAERRILITAIALERYRNTHGSYPQSLADLAPEFLKATPVDFMDGQPLRYHLSDGHFLLYSVGQDCVDHGGKIQKPPTAEEMVTTLRNPNAAAPRYDIVWPLPASSTQLVTARNEQAQADAKRQAQAAVDFKAQAQREEREAEAMRQAAMKKLLAEKPSIGQEPVYQGKPLSVWVGKAGRIEENNDAPQDAVAAIRAIGPQAVPFLLEWMPHPGAEKPVEGFPDWDAVQVAWWALGSEGKAAIPTLVHLLSLPQHTMDDYSVWTESAQAISYLGPDAIVPMLTVATNMEGNHDLCELFHNFENLGTNGTPAVPALIHWAKDPDSWIRDGVVSALGGIGERPDLAVPVLTNALHDSDWMVRRDAGEALGSFANDSDAVLPDLTEVVKHPADWEARAGALAGLGKIRNKPDVVIPLIVPFLNDENSVLDRYAAYALRDLGSKAGFKALLQADNGNIGDIAYEVRKKIETDDWEQSPLRESRVPGILATKWSSDTNSSPEERKIIEFFANTNLTGANLPTMADLLTPKQVITGSEPEELTYEIPVSYGAVANGQICLLLDADTNTENLNAPDSGANIQESLRAANGDTLLVWHTIFDPPGKHALQVEWTYVDTNGSESHGRGPAIPVATSNFCQFSLDCATYDILRGAIFHARLPEENGLYSIECVTTNGQHLKTLSGSTTNGEFNLLWNLVDDDGHRLAGESFNTIVHITLPDSERSQTLRGP